MRGARAWFRYRTVARVCAEVEDHLWQATDGCMSIENQQRAVANFGDRRGLARQYITATLLAHIRWVGLAMIGAATAIFLAMEARVVWYEVMQWELPVCVQPIYNLVYDLSLDSKIAVG
jgi:hypothetical protein